MLDIAGASSGYAEALHHCPHVAHAVNDRLYDSLKFNPSREIAYVDNELI